MALRKCRRVPRSGDRPLVWLGTRQGFVSQSRAKLCWKVRPPYHDLVLGTRLVTVPQVHRSCTLGQEGPENRE